MLERVRHDDVTLIEARMGAVACAFTERTGGVSAPPYASLNLGSHVGDDPAAVRENRRRVLAALGAEDLLDRLLVPNQVHGDHVAVVRSADAAAIGAARSELADGADAVVCLAPDVPVLLCYADCVPVVIACPRGFAVVHSGWRGTLARIGASAARVLARETGCDPAGFAAFIGPHILADEYEVSEELIADFTAAFGAGVCAGPRLLDLSFAIRAALREAGVPDASVLDPQLSTVRSNDRFFSFRAEHGVCGRHAAVAVMRG